MWDGERIEKEKGGMIRCGRRWGRSTGSQEFEKEVCSSEKWKLEIANRKSQMPGTQEVPRTQQG